MYYQIRQGNLKIDDIKNLNEYKIEDHSHKQNRYDSFYFNVYKLIHDSNFIWLREDLKTKTIRDIHQPKDMNEHGFILSFMKLNQNIKIIDENGEQLNYGTVKELYQLKKTLLRQRKKK